MDVILVCKKNQQLFPYTKLSHCPLLYQQCTLYFISRVMGIYSDKQPTRTHMAIVNKFEIHVSFVIKQYFLRRASRFFSAKILCKLTKRRCRISRRSRTAVCARRRAATSTALSVNKNLQRAEGKKYLSSRFENFTRRCSSAHSI